MYWKKEKPFLIADEHEFIKRIQTKQTTFEVINKDTHKLYFDIDYEPKDDDVFDDNLTNVLIEKGLKYVRTGLQCIFQNAEITDEIDLNIAVAESSSKEYKKYSVRFFVSNVLTTKRINKLIVDDLNKMIKNRFDKDENIYNFIDESNNGLFDNNIYNTNRKMRCINTSKPNQNRPLNLVDGTVEQTIITGCFDENMIDLLHYREEETNDADKTDNESIISDITVDESKDEYVNLLECIGSSMCSKGNYTDWWKVGQALKNELKNNANKYFIDWTFKYGTENKKKECFEKITNEIKYTAKTVKNRLTKQSLHLWAKTNNLDLYNKLFKIYIKGNIKSFKNVSVEFEKRHCKIIDKSIFLKENTDEVIVMSKPQLKTSYEHLIFETINDEGDIRQNNFIDAWLTSNPTQRCFDNIGIYPKKSLCPSNIFNMWRDFDMEFITDYKEKPDDLNKILNHIKILCGNDEVIMDYIIKWIAQMIQYPEVKSICPVFISKEGAGKGTLLKLFSKMLGGKKILETSKPKDEVWGQFNGLMANAFLVNLNELSKKDTMDAEGKIKTLMTDPTLNINNKGVNSFPINSYHRFIITTNKEEPINTSKDDRRKLIIRTSDEKIGDKIYFKDLHNILDDVDSVKTCYEYFKNIPDMDKFGELKIPETEYHNDLKSLNITPIEYWIKDLVLENLDKEVIEYSSQDCYDLFVQWCGETHNNYKCSKIQFCVRLKRLSIDGIDSKHKKTGNSIEFDIKKLKPYFGIIGFL
jgi:hypothetical protein